MGCCQSVFKPISLLSPRYVSPLVRTQYVLSNTKAKMEIIVNQDLWGLDTWKNNPAVDRRQNPHRKLSALGQGAWMQHGNMQIRVMSASSNSVHFAHPADFAGLALLENAMSEVQTSDPRNQAFSRRTYINSLTYLLQALPSDLNEVEILYLRQSFPKALQTNQYDPPTHLQSKRGPHSRSALHRILAALILQTFILVHILLPYLKAFLQSVHRYDRKHRVSERTIATIIDTGHRFRKRGVNIACLLLSIKIGALGVLLSWLVEGISGGVYEGVEEGMSIIRTRQQESEIQRMRQDWGETAFES